MKKIFQIFLVLLLSQQGIGQTFIPHAPSITEYSNPPSASTSLNHILHTSAHSLTGMSMGKLYAYSWSGDGTSGLGPFSAGIVVRLHNSAEILIREGFQGLNGVIDLEVGILWQESPSIIYILATYYQSGMGHRAQIYIWNPGTGAFTLHGPPIVLSSSTVYTRISQDIHRHYAGAVTWQDGSNIYVKVFDITSGGVVVGNSILVDNAINGTYPDIAISLPSGSPFIARITYINKTTGDIVVSHEDLYNLLTLPSGSAIPFIIDHIQPGEFSYLTLWNDYTIMSSSLNIDCPNNGSLEDKWAVVFAKPSGDNQVKAISKYSSSFPPVFMNISGILKGQWTSLTYDITGNNIHFGFFSLYPNPLIAPPNQAGFLTVTRQINGAYITGIDTYKRITDPTLVGVGKPVMTFNKNNDCDKLFVVYSGYVATMNFKLLPYPWYSTFSDNVKIEDVSTKDFTVYPNPFSNNINITIPNSYENQTLSVTLVGMLGNIIFQFNGSAQEVSKAVQSLNMGNISRGNYTMNIYDNISNLIYNQKLTKL